MSVVDAAYRHLRRTFAGRLRFEEYEEPMKIVTSPDGRLVAPVMVAMLRSFDTVLFLPDDSEASLQLQVTLEELAEHGPLGHLCDRWQAYHGSPPDVRWALMAIDAAKFEGQFVDGAALTRPNPLAEDEARLCREFNRRETAGDGRPTGFDLLRSACNAHLALRLESPVLVGVDPLGFDVRGTFEVYRLEAPLEMQSAEDVRRALRQLAEVGAQP